VGRNGFGSVAAGGLLGMPSMMCTCCAAPVVAGLRARNASTGGAIAFWLGNSVLNPATLVFMGFVLGWQWLALGVLMVFCLGWAVKRLLTPQEARDADERLGLVEQQQSEGGKPPIVHHARGFFSVACARTRRHGCRAVRRGLRIHDRCAEVLELRPIQDDERLCWTFSRAKI
jgi:uncharacterized membrane protein YraQ (UPF0718 family)